MVWPVQELTIYIFGISPYRVALCNVPSFVIYTYICSSAGRDPLYVSCYFSGSQMNGEHLFRLVFCEGVLYETRQIKTKITKNFQLTVLSVKLWLKGDSGLHKYRIQNSFKLIHSKARNLCKKLTSFSHYFTCNVANLQKFTHP